MKVPISLVLLLGCGGTAAILWLAGSGGAVPDKGDASADPVATWTATRLTSTGGGAPEPGPAALQPGAPSSGSEANPEPHTAGAAPRSGLARRVLGWPHARGAGTKPGDTGGEAPAVPRALAFQALAFVGIDPDATATWLRAIQDPRTPPEDRADLIEDLNEVGYRDNSRPGRDDLPLIIERMRLLERLAPLAIDEVNAAAIDEAYKDLLAMYVRLGGEPAGR